ncbi:MULTISPECIES: MarR family transcriptional regulator [Clostridium]|jgi:DNA-binding MarR family transcriptional regulator|uniref:MarR family transcriptional regulator n=2 Tax=root TaxID=1 RepID=R9BTA3_9CLOT|nr:MULTISPECIES: MarR family transcriptional regulator [Clostridium]EOR19930.1 MarR family transcriptional regulator [Clostridium sartagoforme AAU1]KLE15166.1 MarR family transcriptional regulator [Clostridium sp. C8]
MNNNSMLEISDNLFNLMIQFHNKLMNPNEMTKRVSIPPSHMKVIFYLSRKKFMSVSDVAKCLDISKPNMTPIIDKLISEGYVYRYTNPDDRRKLNIELTEKAYEFLKERENAMKSILLEKISSLDDENLNKLNSLVKDLNEIIVSLK